jgi:hypothetical protein
MQSAQENMATSSYPHVVTVDLASFETKPIRTNEGGTGKTVYINGNTHYGRKGMVTAVLYNDMPLLFPIRPNMNITDLHDKKVESKRLNVELGLPQEADDLRNWLDEFDNWCLGQGCVGTRNTDDEACWYKDLRKQMLAAPPESARYLLTGKYKPVLKRGGSKDGKAFLDSVRVKGDGWFPYIKRLVKEEKIVDGAKKEVVKDCEWHERLVEDGPVGEKDTKFYLYVPSRGKYTDKVPCVGDDKKPIISGTTHDGKPIYKMRWVGPQDAKQYSRITPVVSFVKMYVSSEFGPTLTAKELYVKAAPPKPKSTLAGHDVDASISAEDALAALTATSEAAEAAAASESEAPEAPDAPKVAASPAPPTAYATGDEEEPATAAGERIGRKRTERTGFDELEEEERPKKGVKRARKYAADDDF